MTIGGVTERDTGLRVRPTNLTTGAAVAESQGRVGVTEPAPIAQLIPGNTQPERSVRRRSQVVREFVSNSTSATNRNRLVSFFNRIIFFWMLKSLCTFFLCIITQYL